MTLDKNRKYEFAGDVYEWNDNMRSFACDEWRWIPEEFQHFADKGLVKEVREPIVGRGRVTFNESGFVSDRYIHEVLALTADQAANRTFDIVATEVLP